MAYTPELLATAGSPEQAETMIRAGASAVSIGHRRWGMRLPGDFHLPQVRDTVQLAHAMQARVYVSVNKIIDNEDLPALPDYIKELADARVDALVFGDPAVLMTARRLAPQLALHWNTEMTSTNYATANFWGKRGAMRAVLARELNMEEVLSFKQNTSMQVQVQVHGATNIYHSRRSLVHSYMESRGAEELPSTAPDGRLRLVETERPDQSHPVYEDEGGTHMFSADDICLLECMDELLAGGIDSFKVEGLLKSTEYNETVVRAYRAAIDAYMRDPGHYEMDPTWLEAIRDLQDPERELTFGFMYKEQVY